MRLYPGTLNVELSSPYSLPPDAIRLDANEYGGSVSVSIVPCRIFDRRAFLFRTDQNERGTGHHPRNIIEIATDIRLRDAYQQRRRLGTGGISVVRPHLDAPRQVGARLNFNVYRPTRGYGVRHVRKPLRHSAGRWPTCRS